MKNWLNVFAVLLIVLICSCGKKQHTAHGTNIMQDAELVAIYERDGYEEVYIVNPSGDEMAHYYLIAREDTIPAEIPEDATVLRTPLQKIIIDSEVYASVLEDLNSTQLIRGLLDTQYITSSSLREKLEKGNIENIGPSSSPIAEKIVAMNPDGIILSYYDGMVTGSMEKLGIPVIKMYDLQETSPLGRAEWVRFIGLLIGQQEKTDSLYAQVRDRYQALKTEGKKNQTSKPKVLTETIFQGTWSVPGGNSYQVNFIRDAGGEYFIPSDHSTGSLNLTAEQVLAEGGDADIWLIKFYGDEETLRSTLASDPIYENIKAYKEGGIYFSDTSKSGLFREFPFHPDLLLKDYQIIFSQDTITPLHYFRKLEK